MIPRIHGYAPVGERCSGVRDRRAKERANAVGALYGTGLPTPSLFDGDIDADVFSARIRTDLLPKLPERGVIVTDSASFHKRRDIREAAGTAGHIPEYLPVYSPDLNQ